MLVASNLIIELTTRCLIQMGVTESIWVPQLYVCPTIIQTLVIQNDFFLFFSSIHMVILLQIYLLAHTCIAQSQNMY